MSFMAALLVYLAFVGISVTAAAFEGEQSSAEVRAAFAGKLQDFLNSSNITKVVAEGPDFTTLRIVRPAAFRPQFGSLIDPFMLDLVRLGFKSLILCDDGAKVSEGKLALIGKPYCVERHHLAPVNGLGKLICPTSELCEFVSSPFAQNIFLSFFRKLCFLRTVPPRQEGRTRRHECEAAMRWTLILSRDERHETRTAKACGPGAPWPASSRSMIID